MWNKTQTQINEKGFEFIVDALDIGYLFSGDQACSSAQELFRICTMCLTTSYGVFALLLLTVSGSFNKILLLS